MGLLPHLRNPADVRTLGLVSFYFGLTYFMWNYSDCLFWTAKAALWPILCFSSFCCAAIVHNTMHCAVFQERWANKAWQYLLSISYGHPVSSYVPGHNLSHHVHTQQPKDIMRTTKLRYKWHVLNLLLFQPTVAGAVLKSDLRYLRLQCKLGRPYAAQCIREFGFLMLIQFTLAYMNWQKMILLFWIPHLWAQWGIVNMNLLQHDGCDIVPEEDKTNPNTARNFTGWFLNYVTANNGLHSIHHMYPTMHWSEYPKAHAEQVAPKCHPALNQPSMTKYMFETFVYPGKRVTYTGEPVDLGASYDGPDADWIDYGSKVKPQDIDWNWENGLRFFREAFTLVVIKAIDPMYSRDLKLA